MTAPWSLQRRIVRRVLMVVGLGWLLGLGLSILVTAHEMNELLDESLRQSARYTLALAAQGALPPGAQVPPESGLRLTRDGQELIAAAWPALDGDGGQDVAGWRVFRATDPQRGLAVEVGQSNEWRTDELMESVEAIFLLLLPVLALTLLATRRTIGLAVAPITGFARRLHARRADDLSPLAAADLPRELAPIQDALNIYVARIAAHADAERQFATNAAHELRTPIAAALAQAQLIGAGLAEPDAPHRMTAALQRLGTLVERLLQLSRAEAPAGRKTSGDLVRILRMVVADAGQDLVFDDSDIEQAVVPVHPDALALLLGNLIRNAESHGTGKVRVRLTPGPVVTIGNDVAPDAGFRHDTFDKSPQSPGAGIGLRIVSSIAAREGIAIDYALRDGRATVTLDFRTCAPPA